MEAIVESTMLYNCHARSWRVGEINRLQTTVDNCYRYIWSTKNKPPLREIEEKHQNAWNVRNSLKIKIIRMKIEKRSLARLRHVIRMPYGNENSKRSNFQIDKIDGRK